MAIAKRTLFVTKEKLAEIFGLPEGVDILLAQESKSFEEGVEFLLVSPEEVKINGHKITVTTDNKYSLTRRITLNTLERLNNGEEPYATGGIVNFGDSGVSPLLFNQPPQITTTPFTVDPLKGDTYFNIEIKVDKESIDPKKIAEALKKSIDNMKQKNIDKVRKTTGLSFGDAINELHKGKKVKRAIWGGYWVIEDNEQFGEIIVAYLKDGGKAQATPYNADMLALDWMVVE